MVGTLDPWTRIAEMRIVSNTGTDRVVDILRPRLEVGNRVDLASQALSLFTFAELAGNLARMANVRLVLPPDESDLDLLGSVADSAPPAIACKPRWLAGRCADWIEKMAEVRRANGSVPQGAMVLRNGRRLRWTGLTGFVFVQY